MKVGKLVVKKVAHPVLGELYEISATNTKTQEVVVIEGDSIKLRVSLATAKKLAKVLK